MLEVAVRETAVRGLMSTKFINVGAAIYGVRPKSKKAVKEALALEPSSVEFDTTSFFGDATSYNGDNIPTGVTLVLVGPDPYSARNFYANVTLNAKTGKAKLT